MLARAASRIGLVLLLPSCNAIAGIEEPILSNTSTATNTTPTDRASRFLGDWVSVKARSTETLTCNDAAVATDAPYHFSITSRGGDFIQAKNVDVGDGCVVVLQVVDDLTAPFQVGSHCAFSGGLDITYTSGLLKLVQADVISEANVELAGNDQNKKCVYEGRLLLQKTGGGG